MTDPLATLPDLLARLTVVSPLRIDTGHTGTIVVDESDLRALCAECAAAIRAMMAREKDAVAAELGFSQATVSQAFHLLIRALETPDA